MSLRAFAVVPAAGHSRRMGRPKLLMPWRGRPIVTHLLETWQASQVEQAIVIVRRDDDELAECCQRHGALLVRPETDPPI